MKNFGFRKSIFVYPKSTLIKDKMNSNRTPSQKVLARQEKSKQWP